MFKSLTFGNPDFLFLLIVIPVLAAWYFYRKKRYTADLRVSTIEGFARVGRNLKFYTYHGIYILRLLSITLLIIALARPQTSLSRQDISVEGIDLIVALDVSGSMLAMDFRPDRLEAAKDLAIEFIDGRPNDRIGLVIFSGETFTQCPLPGHTQRNDR
jgi:Ca-activated chloride channel family protein